MYIFWLLFWMSLGHGLYFYDSWPGQCFELPQTTDVGWGFCGPKPTKYWFSPAYSYPICPPKPEGKGSIPDGCSGYPVHPGTCRPIQLERTESLVRYPERLTVTKTIRNGYNLCKRNIVLSYRWSAVTDRPAFHLPCDGTQGFWLFQDI